MINLKTKLPIVFVLIGLVAAFGVIGFTTWRGANQADPQSIVTDAFRRMNTIAPPVETGGEGYRRIAPEGYEVGDFETIKFTEEQLNSCALTTTHERSTKLVELYQQHPFLLDVVATDEIGAANLGNTYYGASFNYDELANYLSSAAQMGYGDKVAACYNLYADVAAVVPVTSDELLTISADTLRAGLPENLKVYLQIVERTRRLATLAILDSESHNLTVAFWFFY